jgi:hypothetical protein
MSLPNFATIYWSRSRRTQVSLIHGGSLLRNNLSYFCTLLVEAFLMRICKSDLSSAQVPSQSQFYVLCWVLSHQPIRCIHRVLDALISCTFYCAYIRLLRSNAPGPALIEREERFFPFLSIALVLSMVPMSLYKVRGAGSVATRPHSQ